MVECSNVETVSTESQYGNIKICSRLSMPYDPDGENKLYMIDVFGILLEQIVFDGTF